MKYVLYQLCHSERFNLLTVLFSLSDFSIFGNKKITMKQNLVFAILYIGYFLNVYVKRSVTFALPEIARSENLDKNQLGKLFLFSKLKYFLLAFWYVWSKFHHKLHYTLLYKCKKLYIVTIKKIFYDDIHVLYCINITVTVYILLLKDLPWLQYLYSILFFKQWNQLSFLLSANTFYHNTISYCLLQVWSWVVRCWRMPLVNSCVVYWWTLSALDLHYRAVW